MPAGTSLSGFSVQVKCQPQGTGELTRYVITATACNMPDANGRCVDVNDAEFVRRTLEAEL
jgi:hypothetical protein